MKDTSVASNRRYNIVHFFIYF